MAETDELVAMCAIGASAGGVSALSALFERLRPDLGLAYVVITHLHPAHPSQLGTILAQVSDMPIAEVADTTTIRPDHVYLIAPDRELVIDGDRLTARPFEQPRGRRTPIDLFFRSLARGRSDGLAVVLSGSGTDGAVGARIVKEAGGVVLVQEPSSAEFPPMPRGAMATGTADVVEPPAALADALAEIVRSRRAVRSLHEDTVGAHVDEILELLRSRTGHDFSSYKRATVLRRIARRMQVTRKESFAAYHDVLRHDASEVQRLFDDLLISVTLFFRDPAAFAALEREVVPALFERADAAAGLRVWVVGCATGEEAYSLAILLLEEAERRATPPAIQIFATDLDEAALETAREGRYPASIAADVSDERLARFFVKNGDYYQIAREVRDVVVFATHSVLKDPPLTRLQLISCRNLLIYFERSLQRQLVELFHYALASEGFLFLGAADAVEPNDRFIGVDGELQLWRARPRADRPLPALPRLPLAPTAAAAATTRAASGPRRRVDGAETLHADALEQHAPPSALVDADGQVLHLSEHAGRFLSPPKGPLRRELAALVRPELRVDLQAALRRAFEPGATSMTLPVSVAFDGDTRRVQMQVSPVRPAPRGEPVRALVVFLEGATVESVPETGADEDTAPAEVRRLREELRTADERLQLSRREHENSVHELRAANEELQSINEEYRSTSEELETSTEELHSMNEEMQTVNAELKSKLETISSAHSDLKNLIAATEIGTLFLDAELRIRLSTPKVSEIFNLTEGDSGRRLTDFTHRLEDVRIGADAREVLAELVPIERTVRTQGQGWLLMRMRPYRTIDDRIDGVVVSFVDITARRQAEESLRASEARLKAILDATATVAFDWNADDETLVEEGPVERLFDVPPGHRHASAAALAATAVPGDRTQLTAELHRAAEADHERSFDVRLAGGDDEQRWLRFRCARAPAGREAHVLGVVQDVSEEKAAAERQTLLVRELNHRVKNTLALVLSILHQTRRSRAAFDDFVQAFEQRVHALADAHDLLTRTSWTGANLGELVTVALSSHSAAEEGRVHVEGPPVGVAANTAISLAMALHELATNAVKHGALSSGGGTVEVRWREEVDAAGDGGRIVFSWRERGGPPVRPPQHKGFGSLLLERGVARDVGGSSSLAFEPEGVTCTITFPVQRESTPAEI